jgi:aminoglycoside phosphotransferase (APT) family kinase protein
MVRPTSSSSFGRRCRHRQGTASWPIPTSAPNTSCLNGATLTGILDWSDAALTDPALDFARLYRDFGPAFLDQTMRSYGGLDGARPRIEYYARCAALEDFAYGQRTGREEYAAAAERSFSWLFPDQRGQS